jgi:hypothetical protein
LGNASWTYLVPSSSLLKQGPLARG